MKCQVRMIVTNPNRTMKFTEFDGELYRDDRMHVLYICKGITTIEGDRVSTTIYHEESPVDAKWCLVTYRNNSRYMAISSKLFDSKQNAEAYRRHIEPMTPLISLGGRPRNPPPPYEEFLRWKEGRKIPRI